MSQNACVSISILYWRTQKSKNKMSRESMTCLESKKLSSHEGTNTAAIRLMPKLFDKIRCEIHTIVTVASRTFAMFSGVW